MIRRRELRVAYYVSCRARFCTHVYAHEMRLLIEREDSKCRAFRYCASAGCNSLGWSTKGGKTKHQEEADQNNTFDKKTYYIAYYTLMVATPLCYTIHCSAFVFSFTIIHHNP